MAEPNKEKKEMPPYYGGLIDNIKGRINAAFGPGNTRERNFPQHRLDYILINGRPISALIAEYQDAVGLGHPEIVNMNDAALFEKGVEMILNAQVHGQNVSWVIPEPRTGAFRKENIQTFAPPEDLEAVLMDTSARQELEGIFNESIPVANDLSPVQVDAQLQESAQLLETRSRINQVDYMKGDFLRDIMNDPKYNPPGAGKTVGNLLEEIENKTTKFTFSRNAFSSLCIALMVNEGADLEQIFDPGPAGQELRARAGKKIYTLAENKNVEEMMKINIQGSMNIGKMIDKELKNIDYSDENAILSDKNILLGHLVFNNLDLQQERDRHKQIGYEVLGGFRGDLAKGAEAKAKYEKEYTDLNDQVIAFLPIKNTVLQNRVNSIENVLGMKRQSQYSKSLVPESYASMMVQNLIVEAQRNGEPIEEKLSVKNQGQFMGLDALLKKGNLPGKEKYNRFVEEESLEGRKAFSKSMLSGDLKKGMNIGLDYHEDGTVTIAFEENPEGYSSRFSHSAKERTFFNKEFQIPVTGDHDVTGNDITNINRTMIFTLRDQFHMTSDSGTQGRLFFLDETNHLVPMDGLNIGDAETRNDMRRLLINGRLFAVKENETTPVQLGIHKDSKNQWVCTATDCLDNEPEPVEYRWYHVIANALGLQFGIDQKAAYDAYQAKLAIADTVRRVSETRKPLTSFATISGKAQAIEHEAQEAKLKEIAIESVKDSAAKNALDAIYGSKPVLKEHQVKGKCYTKEQFDSLKNYDLNLAGEPEVGNTPKVDQNGRIQFREDDFVALSIAAAATAELGGSTRKDTEDSQLLDTEMVVDANSTMFINDFAMIENPNDIHSYDPRPNVGGYIKNAVAPARDRVAKAIEAYNAGDNTELASIIANGLAFAGRNYTGAMGSVPPADRALVRYFNSFGDLMAADPALSEKVKDTFENMKMDAKNKQTENEVKRNNFNRENGDYMKSVADGLAQRRKQSENLTPLSPEKIKAVEEQHKFFYEDNPKYYDMLQEDAILDARDKFYEINSNLSLDYTLERLRYQKAAADIVEKGDKAQAELNKAELEGKTIDPDKKLQLMKDIVKGQLIQVCDTKVKVSCEQKGDKAAEEHKSITKLLDVTLLPEQRIHDRALAKKDQSNGASLLSLNTSCTMMFHNAMKHKGVSDVTKLIADPQNGEAAFETIFGKMYPDQSKFKNMQPKYLLEASKKASSDVAEYQKKLVQTAAKERNPERQTVKAQHIENDGLKVPSNQGAMQK